jgi:hypothetical protein
MDSQTLAYLHAHGVTSRPKTLNAMLAYVIEQLPSVAHFRNPEDELACAETAELKAAGFDLDPRELGEEDPLGRSVALYAGMLAKSMSVNETAKLLGVNASRVRQRLVRERSLYGIKQGSEWRVPMFQFEGDTLVPGIDKVFAALPRSLNPVAVLSWLMTPNPDLEEPRKRESGRARQLSPRDWLLTGNPPEAVVELATAL